MMLHIKTVAYEEAVCILGDTYTLGVPFVEKAPEPAPGYIISIPGEQYHITQKTFIELCTNACISAQGAQYVPTRHCADAAAELR